MGVSKALYHHPFRTAFNFCHSEAASTAKFKEPELTNQALERRRRILAEARPADFDTVPQDPPKKQALILTQRRIRGEIENR
jgi:hypothetical protein